VTAAVTVVSAIPAGRGDDAAALVFEYMAITLAEAGLAMPAGIDGLPPALQYECCNLPAVYHSPGTVLIACHREELVGCVGLMSRSPERTGEIRRLYVRPAHRGQGIARTLMSHAHHHAAQHGITRLILDVLPTRTSVISFYYRLGYTDTEPFPTGSPVPMVYMERSVTRDDILPIRTS